MSYTFLQEQGEVSSAESFSAIPAHVLSKLNLTAEMSYYNGNGMECCPDFQSGMTCEHSMAHRGGAESISSAVGSRAKIFPLPVAELESKETGADCGKKWHALPMRFDPISCSWKTHLCLFAEDLPLSLVILPKWGLIRNGELFRRRTPEHRIKERDSGLWASTPTRVMPLERHDPGERTSKIGRKKSKSGIEGSANWSQNVLQLGMTPTPNLAEFYMGLPIGWTDLQPLEMVKFQSWLNLHGRLYNEAR